MNPVRFDALTEALGTARSRRGALKTLGAVAIGALGFARLSGEATAKPAGPRGNHACAAFCHAVFGDTRAAGQCTSEAAHGDPDGLCARCGADPANYCDGSCCTDGATCQAGSCVVLSFCETHEDLTDCGTNGKCLGGRCFRVYSDAAPCGVAVAANTGGLNVCIANVGSGHGCTDASDCDGMDFCAITGHDGNQCWTGIAA